MESALEKFFIKRKERGVLATIQSSILMRLKICFATLTNEQKNRYSHRAKAVAKLIEFSRQNNYLDNLLFKMRPPMLAMTNNTAKAPNTIKPGIGLVA
jgi:hypothetical protein